MDRFLKACKEFALTISIIPTSIYIDCSIPSVVDSFTFLESTISSNLSLDVEINARIGKAATVMAKLNSLPGMCNKHTPLWKWNVDTLR